MNEPILDVYLRLMAEFTKETEKFENKRTAASAGRLRKLSNEITAVGKEFRKESVAEFKK